MLTLFASAAGEDRKDESDGGQAGAEAAPTAPRRLSKARGVINRIFFDGARAFAAAVFRSADAASDDDWDGAGFFGLCL